MKYILVLSTLIFSFRALAAAPVYTLSSKEPLGSYVQTPKGCRTVDHKPCADAEVKKVDGKLVLVISNYNYPHSARVESFPLTAANGRLVFSWENTVGDDCDDPGCGNLLSVKGVVYPKKVGNKYVPAIKIYVTHEYNFPDEEGAPEGEVTETETFIKM